MTERLTLSLYEPTQAHKAIGATWKHVKAMLVAGHRLVLEVRPETRSLRQNARPRWCCSQNRPWLDKVEV